MWCFLCSDMSQLTITYIGNTSTGSNGDVKQIRGAINDMLNGGGNQVDKLVTFECLDLGVKICDISTKNVSFDMFFNLFYHYSVLNYFYLLKMIYYNMIF